MYKLTASESIIRLIDGATIPLCLDNTDYRQYLAWVDEGNTPEPVDLPSADALASLERQWRDNELVRVDREINKIQDGGGIGTEAGWRQYRIALRNWPESQYFPEFEKRPSAP